jgi:parvulin-like peptidyl-prolyl isomerase
VDRIVAVVEGDIITWSEVRELGRLQQLIEGRSASEAQLLTQLIEQWIVNTEARAARLPRPTEAEVQRELHRLERQFATPKDYQERLRQVGLTATAVRRFVQEKLYLARYLDYKFRPAAQVSSAQIEEYYRTELTRQLKARGQPVPPLETLEEQIRELLVQRQINERAERWLNEARARLKIERPSAGGLR